jgi:hydroxymethylglutaryl-CoA reductase
MARSSRISRFFTHPISERRRLVADETDCDVAELNRALADGGLDAETADKTIENVLGTYALAYSVALNLRVNQRDYIVPMVIEEPSVVAAASNAAKMARLGGGFEATADEPRMVAQVQRWDVPEPALATSRIHACAEALLARANAAVPALVARGGGARAIEVRDLGDGLLVVHVVVDVRDAMGANLANTVAEAVAPAIAELAGGIDGLRILSNLADERCVRVRARVPASALAGDGVDGDHVCEAIVRASRFAERDPYRAATHNKGIMNGVDAVALATGNDWRAVEAGAHAFAARDGRYRPLAVWRRDPGDGALTGEMTLPLALGTVSATARIHRGARLALKILGVGDARELAMVAASVGLASNLAALRALATEGIQRGHMALHARSVARAAGAVGDEVDRVAARIAEAQDVTMDAARLALEQLRGPQSDWSCGRAGGT